MNKPLSLPLYADGIGKIRHENGVIKVDLVSIDDHYISPGAQPQKVQHTLGTIVFSPAGFSQALKTMTDMAATLEKASQKPEKTKA